MYKSSLLKKYFLDLLFFYCTALFYWIYNVCYLLIYELCPSREYAQMPWGLVLMENRSLSTISVESLTNGSLERKQSLYYGFRSR